MDARFFIIGFLCFSARPSRGFPSSVDRIINGSDSDIHSVPYMLSFALNDKYACCAAIINRHWAVTAAHCARQAIVLDDEVTVRSGTSVLSRSGSVHRVTEIVIHEDYDELTNDYDIAVIRVTPPFGDRTRPVGLAPDDAEDVSVGLGLVCGWGYYKIIDGDVDPRLSQRLRCIRLPLISKSECRKDYRGRFPVTPRMTCYGFEDGEGDSCQGDSGSPLVNEDDILIGVTSWGYGCAQEYLPGVYTDTVYLRNWIKDNAEA